jgi:hypothetical protein
MELSEEERLLVSVELRESVPREPAEEVEAAWSEEIERRLSSLDRGETASHLRDEVVERIRAKLHRA